MKKNLILLAGLLAVSFSSSIYSYRIRLYNDSDQITIKADIYLNTPNPLTVYLSRYGTSGYYQDIDTFSDKAFTSVNFTAYDLNGRTIGTQTWTASNWRYGGKDIRFELFLRGKNGFYFTQVDFDKSTAY